MFPFLALLAALATFANCGVTVSAETGELIPSIAISRNASDLFAVAREQHALVTVEAWHREMLDRVNNEHGRVGAAAVCLNNKLMNMAQYHSDDQAAHQTMSHQSSNGDDMVVRLRRFGVNYNRASENVAMGQGSVADAMNSWMNSPPHRANLLDGQIRFVGFGMARDSNNRPYWTQNFAAGAETCMNGGGGGGNRGDWEFCSRNDECRNQCCSNQYSDDGELKCTPGGCQRRGDWDFCSRHEECRNNCCSNRYSDDGRLKCTPGGC